MSVNPTQQFIDYFNKHNNAASVSKCMHDHPTAVKAAQAAAAVLGVIAILAAPFSVPIVGASIALGICLVGVGLLTAAVLSWVFLKYGTCAKHDMSTHAFQEAACEGGRLYYRNDVPILELTEDPAQTGEQFGYLCGKAHGFLLGSHIYELKKSLDTIIHTIMRQPRAHKIKTLIETVCQQIPKSYQLEIAGLSDGYNEWAINSHVKTSMTTDEILLIHLIADSKHFHTKVVSKMVKEMTAHPVNGMADDLTGGMACTTLLHRDQEKGVEFGRNMDWCPFGKGGAKSLVIVWKGLGIAVLGVPGIIGAITGWNRHGLAAAMNVCPGNTTQVRGMPACLFNRHLLENADSVAGVKELTEQNRPLGPYHLTLADKQDEGACISFYQDENETDHIRDLQDEEPLLTVNWRYPACEGGYFDSKGRTEKLKRFFQEAAASIPKPEQDWSLLIDNGLKLTSSWITMHSLRFQPKADRVFINTDNGYAASADKKGIRMSEVF